MYEPRGHHGMYGCIITPPASNDTDFGVLFMHNEGWSTMCGHGIIAVVTYCIETGVIDVLGGKQRFVIDSPAGKVIAYVEYKDSQVESVSFDNVPSFVFKKDFTVQIDDHKFQVDIAFGGAFYAIVNSSEFGLKVNYEDLPVLQTIGGKIKHYIENKIEVSHPLEKDLKGIYGVIFSDEPQAKDAHLCNVTIFADEQVDRSPCGTGTSARLATLVKRENLKEGESFIHECITGGKFIGEVLGRTKVDGFDAIVPKVTGQAFITGFHQFVVDPRDPLKQGFLLA